MKKLLLIFLLLAAMTAFAACGEAAPTEEETPRTDEDMITVSVTVDCHTAIASALLKQNLRGSLPTNGLIVDNLAFSCQPGTTAEEAIKAICVSGNIPCEFGTMPGMDFVCVEGISNLYQSACGDLSGWLFSVNGEFPSYSIAEYTLQDGDELLFVYTCDMGEDLGLTW